LFDLALDQSNRSAADEMFDRFEDRKIHALDVRDKGINLF
jgi:hypothetical protein